MLYYSYRINYHTVVIPHKVRVLVYYNRKMFFFYCLHRVNFSRIAAHTVMANEAGECVTRSATANDASAPP